MKPRRTISRKRLRLPGEDRVEFGAVEACMAIAISGVIVSICMQLAGCTAAQRQKARSVNDVADMACELFATEQAEKAGLSLGDIANAVTKACDVKDANRGIVDALLAAKREGEAERAGRMGLIAPDAGADAD